MHVNERLSQYKISVVVPAYNEERLIGETLRGIPEYVSRIYVVDDCSTDNTYHIVKGFNDSRIVLIRNDKNLGVGGAISAGYKLAIKDGMEIVAVMAGDNQMDPEQLSRLLMPIIGGWADYTKGNRLLNSDYRNGMSAWRTIGNYLLTFLNKFSSGYWHIVDAQNGYTAISVNALKMLDLDTIYRGYAFENDMLTRLNIFDAKVVNIPIPARYGAESSKIRYASFIIDTSIYFIKAFIWRVWKKYVIKLHPIGMLYVLGIVLAVTGMFALFNGNYIFFSLGILSAMAAVLLEILRDARLYWNINKIRDHVLREGSIFN